MILLKDNSTKVIRITPECEDIRLFANQTIESIVNSNPGLLIYPQSLRDCEDTLKQQYILSEYETVNGAQQRFMHVSTGNLVGFIGTSLTNVSICSRFAENESIGRDYFIHYMLQKVLSINLFNLNHSISTEDQVFDFLLLLFPKLLKDAVAQGIYKEYISIQRNDANIKGVINICRHLKQNIPFRGTVAYNSREISYDNNVTQLIRHTIEYISSSDFGKSILSLDKDTIEAVNQIKAATKSYSRNSRLSIIRENARSVNHPFFTRYNDLQKLCLRILRHQKMKYGSKDSKINGILFDVSWLWEEYLAELLPSFCHPQNRKKRGAICLAAKNSLQRYPDFYMNDSDGIVLDAKYKRNVTRDDEHQVISYMYRLKSRLGGFILPCEYHPEKVSFSLLGYGNSLQIFNMQIPQACDSFASFCEQMQLFENTFKSEISKLIEERASIYSNVTN